MNISQDILLHQLFPFLTPIDLFVLRQVNKGLKTLITKTVIHEAIIRQVNSRLYKIFRNKTTEFKQAIRECKGIISGSFIIQCILNKFWKSDVDIYYPSDDENYNKHINGHDIIETFLIANNYEDVSEYECNYDGEPDITNVSSYAIKGFPDVIQLIKIENKKDIYKHIISHFDLNICMNMYSIDYDTGREQLYTHSLGGIFNGVATYSGDYSEKGISRCHKYVQRGFYIPRISLEQIYDILDKHYTFTIRRTSNEVLLLNFKYYKKLLGYNYQIITGNPNILPKNYAAIIYDNKALQLYRVENEVITCSDCIFSLCDKSVMHYHYDKYTFIIVD